MTKFNDKDKTCKCCSHFNQRRTHFSTNKIDRLVRTHKHLFEYFTVGSFKDKPKHLKIICMLNALAETELSPRLIVQHGRGWSFVLFHSETSRGTLWDFKGTQGIPQRAKRFQGNSFCLFVVNLTWLTPTQLVFARFISHEFKAAKRDDLVRDLQVVPRDEFPKQSDGGETCARYKSDPIFANNWNTMAEK